MESANSIKLKGEVLMLKLFSRYKYILSLAIIISSLIMIYTKNLEENNVNYKEINYTVQSGDTLWKIAGENVPKNLDRRVYMDEVRRLNNMESSNLQIGQELIILTKE